MQAGSLLLLAISLLFDNNLVESSFANLVTGLTITAIVGIVLFWKEIVAGFDYFKEETLWRIFSIFLWVGLIFLVDVIIQKIMSNNLIANQQDVLSFGAQVPLLVTLFFLAIVGPIAEELVFRQVLMNCLSETIGIACTTMISIFLFTFMHTQQPLDFLIYLPGAILLSAAYLKLNRSLVFVMAIHIVNNMFGFLL
ncbi:CPBP family intramembrane metalloprotease [Enterococcus faecalis]|uniref:CPBP family intramembrane glutamic endopeptidase n=1 Tax=Enterococcus faecalis TaxID=1351 RepID=UPI0012E30CF7|nr:CPBP family intramembrane glutamic endopeptidase [Enterococcus faecalis]EHT2877611.1 CPBP family intramembrane metalloprotease [Enterococcus faecalis]MUO23444.1 CPBP family intramembrane metalloprotease [Enterococcus faecalis]